MSQVKTAEGILTENLDFYEKEILKSTGDVLEPEKLNGVKYSPLIGNNKGLKKHALHLIQQTRALLAVQGKLNTGKIQTFYGGIITLVLATGIRSWEDLEKDSLYGATSWPEEVEEPQPQTHT